jgi:hypothetical protein
MEVNGQPIYTPTLEKEPLVSIEYPFKIKPYASLLQREVIL